jgi:hypothetical protein
VAIAERRRSREVGRWFTMRTDRVKEIEQKIAELKARWPAHSAPPDMWEELEDLESELREAERACTEEDDGRETGSGRLP